MRNYVEPFFGSGAVLLGRPQPFIGTETVNDKDMFVANFWRALQADPDAVARFADWPVNEADLEARHHWLVNSGRALLEYGMGDPRWYDAEIAGWWVWGISAWIGGNWCGGVDGGWRWSPDDGWRNSTDSLGSRGVYRRLPHLSAAGQGINRGNQPLRDYMTALAYRLRYVRVCCGDWSRICGPSPTTLHGLTGVFLDPPYDTERDDVYASEDRTCSALARQWCIANGDNPMLRIALCGHDTEHASMPDTWSRYAWKTRGGYGSRGNGRGRSNAAREMIWFSPHCLSGETLFDGMGDDAA